MEEQMLILIAVGGLFAVPLICGAVCIYSHIAEDIAHNKPIKKMSQEDIDYYDGLPLK